MSPTQSDRFSALSAAARLVGAVYAEVVVHDLADDTVRPVASSRVSSNVVACPIAEAVRTQASSVPDRAGPSWVVVDAATQESAWLTKLHDQASLRIFVILGFAEDSAIARTRVGRIAPDLAMLVGMLIRGGGRERETEEAAMVALDHGECGVIAVRADRSIIFSNAAATNHVATGTGLQVRRDRIVVDDRRFETALQRRLDAFEEGAVRPPATVMLLKSKGDARPVVIVIAPARSKIGGAHEGGAAALIYIIDPASGALHGLDALCQLHGLSGVESRLLIHLANGVTLGDAATVMRIKLETARTYLKQIFAKTGTHRQTDLAIMMIRYLRAFRGGFDFQPV